LEKIMSATTSRRYASTASLAGLSLAVVACGGSSSRAASGPPAATGSSAVAQAATSPNAGAHVKAGGGGNFCQLVAAAANSGSVSGLSPAAIKSRIASVRVIEAQALALAPGSIKSDIRLLFAASDKMYSDLAKANYNYSKIDTSSISELSDPKIAAAEGRLRAYITNVCKIG
jgi:hypothetical protein